MSDRDCTSPTRPMRVWWARAANPKTPAGQRHPREVSSPAARSPRQPRRVPRLVVRSQRDFEAVAFGVVMRLVEGTHAGIADPLTEVITISPT